MPMQRTAIVALLAPSAAAHRVSLGHALVHCMVHRCEEGKRRREKHTPSVRRVSQQQSRTYRYAHTVTGRRQHAPPWATSGAWSRTHIDRHYVPNHCQVLMHHPNTNTRKGRTQTTPDNLQHCGHETRMPTPPPATAHATQGTAGCCVASDVRCTEHDPSRHTATSRGGSEASAAGRRTKVLCVSMGHGGAQQGLRQPCWRCAAGSDVAMRRHCEGCGRQAGCGWEV